MTRSGPVDATRGIKALPLNGNGVYLIPSPSFQSINYERYHDNATNNVSRRCPSRSKIGPTWDLLLWRRCPFRILIRVSSIQLINFFLVYIINNFSFSSAGASLGRKLGPMCEPYNLWHPCHPDLDLGIFFSMWVASPRTIEWSFYPGGCLDPKLEPMCGSSFVV